MKIVNLLFCVMILSPAVLNQGYDWIGFQGENNIAEINAPYQESNVCDKGLSGY